MTVARPESGPARPESGPARPGFGPVRLGAGEVRLGPGAEIPVGEGRAYAVDGEQVAVFRLSNGTLRAVSAICPHAGGPLADGQIDEQVLICPLHLNLFDLTTGCSLSGQPDLTSYPVTEDPDGNIVIPRPQTQTQP